MADFLLLKVKIQLCPNYTFLTNHIYQKVNIKLNSLTPGTAIPIKVGCIFAYFCDHVFECLVSIVFHHGILIGLHEWEEV